jgi:predicted nuclease with TOPRIM domain
MRNRLELAGLPHFMTSTDSSRSKHRGKYMEEEDVRELVKEKENLLKVLENKRQELKAAEERYEAVVPTLRSAEEDREALQRLHSEHTKLQDKANKQANTLTEYEEVTETPPPTCWTMYIYLTFPPHSGPGADESTPRCCQYLLLGTR